MPSTITTVQQIIEVDGSGSVTMTDPVFDEVSGQWARDVRIVGEKDLGVAGKPLVFTLRIKSSTKAGVEITTPNLVF